MNKLTLRKVHRYLGLIAGIQLLAWTLSGLYFTLIPINEVRGDHLLDVTPAPPAQLTTLTTLSPAGIAKRHHLTDVTAASTRLTDLLGSPVWVLGQQRFDAVSGDALPPITAEQARDIATSRTLKPIAGIDRIESTAVDHEYRGGELPAWRVTLEEPADAVIYIGMTTGRLRAVRTNEWRLFDFLWSLHIMDYEEREDFNHLLIQALAILGLLTVMSGLTLFFLTQRWSRQ